MQQRLRGRRIVCFYPWTPFEATGAWSRFQCMWRFFLDQGAHVTLAFLSHGADVRLRNLTLRYPHDFNMVGAVWRYSQHLAATAPRPELRALSQAELSLLLMFEKGVYSAEERVGRWFDEVIADHDVVTCEYPMLLPALSEVCRRHKKPLIATTHDALFELHGTSQLGKESLRVKEVEALSLADQVVFCTERERALFETFKIQGCVVRNTGDALGLTPGRESESRQTVVAAIGLKTPQYALFVGSAHGPNLDAVVEVKKIAALAPELSFVIAGSCCAKSTDGNVVALGPVEDTLLDLLYRGAAVVLVPLTRGTGMSVKTYEACNYAKAVVSTAVGARGFAVEAGRELLLTETPAAFAAAVRGLLADATRREQLGQAARRLAVSLDYRMEFQPYADVVERLVPATAASAASDASSAARTLVLVDNNLANRVGHHYNYALSLREHCLAVGVGFAALVRDSADPDVLRELDGVPVFQQGLHEQGVQNPYPAEWGALRGMFEFLSSNDLFARDLEAGLRGRAAVGDVIFLPNATPKQILGLALLLRKNPIYRLLRYVLLLRYSVNLAFGPITARKNQLDREAAEQYAFSFEKLYQSAPPGGVRLTTDSEELAKEYGALAKRPVDVLPIPHTANEVRGASFAGVPTKSKTRLRVVFLGDAREEKGFELLLPVVRACAQEPWASRVELVIQSYVSSDYHMRMGSVIQDLSNQKAPNLHLVGTALSAEAYQYLLTSADLVLLPYDTCTYRARTSGPFVEALCAGKPVVVPANSWMSGQLGNSGAGRTFVSGNSGDLVSAVLAALQNHPAHAQAAEELGRRYREFHNPGRFVQELMR